MKNNINASVLNGEEEAFSRFGRIPLDTADKLWPPRSSIHLISSSPSFLVVALARHDADWPWAKSMSRSGVYRRMNERIFTSIVF